MQAEIAYIPYSQAYAPGFEDMQRRVPDIAKIGRTIGWRPGISLDEILRDVIAYERDDAGREAFLD